MIRQCWIFPVAIMQVTSKLVVTFTGVITQYLNEIGSAVYIAVARNLLRMKVAVLFAALFANFYNIALADTKVELTLGNVVGKKIVSPGGKDIFAFLGVPYAQAPVEELRFQRPVPVQPWDGVHDATKESPLCPQVNFATKKYAGKEDCLFLNIYTPKLPSSNENGKYPVMVFIHGGGFVQGTSNPSLYNPGRLVDKAVVFVAISYRLGVLGFVSTEDDISPGNYGLFDQSLALKWVKEHISKFGGNPESVTIFGESAGAASVGYHMLSPHSKGLFHGAILQSGTPLNDWALQENPKLWAKRISILLKCGAHSSKILIDCLKTKTAKEIVEAQTKLETLPMVPMVYTPVVEKGADGFITDTPESLLAKGKFHKVPVIIGQTSDEGAFFYALVNRHLDQLTNEYWNEDLPFYLTSIGDIPENTVTVSKAIRQAYLDSKGQNDKFGYQKAIIQVYSDIFFCVGLDVTSKYFVKAGIPTYAYVLKYRGKSSFTDAMGMKQKIGVSHVDDIQYMFETDLFPKVTGEDAHVAENIVSLWTNFAYKRNPTPDGSSLPFKWEQNEAKNPKFLEITYIPAMAHGRFSQKTEFWREDIHKLSGKAHLRDEL